MEDKGRKRKIGERVGERVEEEQRREMGSTNKHCLSRPLPRTYCRAQGQ